MTTTATTLDAPLAAKFASLALAHIGREYPNKMDHVMRGPEDLVGPRAAHPIFFGSFDWHSCVHGYWLLATVRRRFPALAESTRVAQLFDERLTPANVEAERAYAVQPERGTFERPYGWAWLLMLQAELARDDSAEGRRWSATLAPLADAFAGRFRVWLPKATYPIRVGTHFNTAFAIALALEYAEVVGDAPLAAMLRERALAWYADDVDCQAWEPGGDDFLSGALVEAECMRRVLGPSDFAGWLGRFLPRIAQREPATLFTPATVSDRTDGKIAHLDGLNLSRAWCWRSIARALGADDARRPIADAAADEHLASGLPYVAGDYMGEHWLATYALLACMMHDR